LMSDAMSVNDFPLTFWMVDPIPERQRFHPCKGSVYDARG
jgi:hypothetical protein